MSKLLNPGFLGVSNEESREAALKLPFDNLVDRAYDLMSAQASYSQRIQGLIDIAQELNNSNGLPSTSKMDAILESIKRFGRDWDNALCDTGGFLEALLVRLERASALIDSAPSITQEVVDVHSATRSPS